jgi:hypothetical protein
VQDSDGSIYVIEASQVNPQTMRVMEPGVMPTSASRQAVSSLPVTS